MRREGQGIGYGPCVEIIGPQSTAASDMYFFVQRLDKSAARIGHER